MLNFITKALIKKQLKGVPEAEVEKLLTIIEKNPEFFKMMAEEVQKKVKAGMSQEEAAKQFANEHGAEMKEILGK
jgi:hypothetical protein